MKKQLASRYRIKKEHDKTFRRKIRHISIRKKISGSELVPRLCITKSNRNILLQLIDDEKAITIFSVHSYKISGNKKLKSEFIANELVNQLKKRNINRVILDRGGNLYSQRIKIIGDKILEKGLL